MSYMTIGLTASVTLLSLVMFWLGYKTGEKVTSLKFLKRHGAAILADTLMKCLNMPQAEWDEYLAEHGIELLRNYGSDKNDKDDGNADV
jgi:hypothetical protein